MLRWLIQRGFEPADEGWPASPQWTPAHLCSSTAATRMVSQFGNIRLTGMSPAQVLGAKWGAIISRCQPTQSLLKRSIMRSIIYRSTVSGTRPHKRSRSHRGSPSPERALVQANLRLRPARECHGRCTSWKAVITSPRLHRERASCAMVVSGVLADVSGCDTGGRRVLEPLRRTIEVRGVLSRQVPRVPVLLRRG